MKNALRAVLIVAFLFTAQFGYGLSFDGLLGASAAPVTPLPEPASLVALGLAMLLFASGARRKPGSAQGDTVVGASVASQKKPLLRAPQRYAA